MDERGDGDALSGPDGTGPGRRGDDPTVAPAAASDLRLPPGPTDRDGITRWMDDDRERALRPLGREVPPPRPVRRQRVLPPEYTDTSAPVPAPREESAWRRERREEAEFRAQFGEWRPGVRPPGRRSGGGVLGGVRLGAPLIVLVAVLIAVFALALAL
ncbi:hypothetical protein WCD74_17285 [Actinomycetospora sp. OC33-EN08]|uniref:Uncharacterized protein n=1 Tax=Actinomycetospora aurantiaca TaxID=3129233 RepID=A0ABU8MRF9_9PSEU